MISAIALSIYFIWLTIANAQIRQGKYDDLINQWELEGL